MGCSSCAARRKAAEEARRNKINGSAIPKPIPTPINEGSQPSPKFISPLVLPPAKK